MFAPSVPNVTVLWFIPYIVIVKGLDRSLVGQLRIDIGEECMNVLHCSEMSIEFADTVFSATMVCIQYVCKLSQFITMQSSRIEIYYISISRQFSCLLHL